MVRGIEVVVESWATWHDVSRLLATEDPMNKRVGSEGDISCLPHLSISPKSQLRCHALSKNICSLKGFYAKPQGTMSDFLTSKPASLNPSPFPLLPPTALATSSSALAPNSVSSSMSTILE